MSELLKALKQATAALDKAASALLADANARESITDPAEWTRMPKTRCPLSNWSPSTLRRKVPVKKVGGTTFYSLAAVRKLLNEP
jgi:hypothetical protein